MTGVPDCADCGAMMQQMTVPPAGAWWRCPWAQSETAVRDDATITRRYAPYVTEAVQVVRCGRRPGPREPIAGHFSGNQ